MNNNSSINKRYLTHLGLVNSLPSIGYLKNLIKAQLTKFPFENISKLILWKEGKANGLIDFESHLNNSILFNCGGTCYANNYYFSELLSFSGFDVNLHGANMGMGKDVHLVLIVKLDNKKYLVDVGYGAPFFNPFLLTDFKQQNISWGELEYTLSKTENSRFNLTVRKRDQWVHDYIVNPEVRNIDHFSQQVVHSFREESEFMNRLRIIRFFDNHSIELNNNKYIINKKNKSEHYFIKNIAELKNILKFKFHLPSLPIDKALNIFSDLKKIDIFAVNN